MAKEQQVAEIVIESIYNAGVKVVYGIPGAKIDALFDCLQEHPEIRLIVCRHEQNAAMMAAAHGRITGIPGVCIATSGPGAGNLTTGLITATTEGDPVVALIGSVPRVMSEKHTHQSMKALDILRPTSKYAASVDVEDQAAELVLAAFRKASAAPQGSTVIAIPKDVADGKSKILAFPSQAFASPPHGVASQQSLDQLIKMIHAAKLPVLFLGMRASSPQVVSAVRKLISVCPIATIETFQAAGAVSKELVHLFYGRVGLFRNQTGDKLLAKSDLVITVGYDPTEYDTSAWNPEGNLNIAHIDYQACDYGKNYAPQIELLGAIEQTVEYLADNLKDVNDATQSKFCQDLWSEFRAWKNDIATTATSGLVQPLHFISLLQEQVSKDTTVVCDVGTVYIYMMRYFFAYEPRRLLCSDGQQTLGIALPWAISASLIQDPPCSQKVISMSGDGGFMFSAQEMSTAVQQGCDITHFIWNDSAYNMVQFQEEMKYGRSSGIKLGGVDFAKFAESFGAKGFKVDDASQLEAVMKEALAFKGVSLVDIKIDYSHVQELADHLIKDSLE